LITSATSLVFGFDLDEIGVGLTEYVVIDSLTITIGKDVFDLGPNQVEVHDWAGTGSNLSEAFFKIDLGYDFMEHFDANSLEDFKIKATSSAVSNGPEEFFLDAIMTGQNVAPVPEPASILLIGLGLAGIMGFSRKFRARQLDS